MTKRVKMTPLSPTDVSLRLKDLLPQDVLGRIFTYDPTGRSLFNRVLYEFFKLRNGVAWPYRKVGRMSRGLRDLIEQNYHDSFDMTIEEVDRMAQEGEDEFDRLQEEELEALEAFYNTMDEDDVDRSNVEEGSDDW
jgi:hypothetical protein